MNITARQQPTIIINLTPGIANDDIAQLLYGMEEEGIPFQFSDKSTTTLVQCAYDAANQSPLAVGIAVSRDEIIIHYKNLPADNPLFVMKDYLQQEKEMIRQLGCNAARLVKGLPFKNGAEYNPSL